jgi:hypothetical protein
LSNVHLAQLRLGTTGDLLGAQGHELLLEIIKLLLEVLLVLAPELLASDLAGRLLNPPVSISSHVQNTRAVGFTIVKVGDMEVVSRLSRVAGAF